jgi:hypothetical protein
VSGKQQYAYSPGLGKYIPVEEAELDQPARKKKRPEFTAMSLRWAAHMAKAAGIPGATVLVLLHYMAWKARSSTFPLSNTLLTKYGVDRRVKYRVLTNLEKSGEIRIERRGTRRAPIITLLTPP